MKYGLIGEKLGHSFSAEIHPRLFGYEYELKEIPRDELDRFLSTRDFSAINVTIPYKEMVLPYLDVVDETAQKIGAVNTVVNRNGKLYGYNTDFYGLCALIRNCGMELQNKTVLILGSGGTSKTALAVAEYLGCCQAVRVSRSAKEGCISYKQAKQDYRNAEILINTTPSGMHPHIGESAVDVADYPALQGVVDVVYNPLRTKLVCDALERGIPAVGGLYMLVAQAAFAAEKFVDRTVSGDAIEAIYHSLLNEKQNVVLVGMPGSGKTTVGQKLAQQLGFDFVDTDAVIVEREKRPITEIFAVDGEARFRDMESAVIRDVSARQRCVIATGGGAVLRPENCALLRENGRIYFLDRSLEQLTATADRPLASNEEALKQRYRERYDVYCSACYKRINADTTVEEVVNRIREDRMV